MKKLLASLLLLTLVFYCLPPVARAISCGGSGFSYCRTITIDHTKVPNTDQVSFPIEVCANSTPGVGACSTVTGLNQTGGGAHVSNSNGYDINFFTDSACTTKVTAWEMEKYVASTGEMIAWVNDGTLSHTADTVFYMCYGNSGISTFQGGGLSSVWNTGYVGVYHFPNGSSLSIVDSSGNGNNGTLVGSPTATTGQIDGGVAVVAGSSGVTLGTTPYTALNNNYTLTGWGNMSAGGCGYGAVIGDNSTGVYLGFNPSGNAFAKGPNNNQISSTPVLNAWHHFVLTISSTTGQILYIDATAVATDGTATGGTTPSVSLSAGSSDGCAGTGSIDEVRVSNVVRSGDWIKTEYNNQSSPSTFETFGAESSGTAVNLFLFMWI